MASSRAALCWVLLQLLLVPSAFADTVIEDVRAKHWAEAQSLAAGYADPVAAKLVAFYRLLAPGAASAGEIADFMAQNPDWPWSGQLAKRRDEALAAESDNAAVVARCGRVHPEAAAA